MAIYSTRFTSQIETYLRVCDFRAKLDKCPKSPKTLRYKEKLDRIIHATEPKLHKANDTPEQWQGPVKINGTYEIRPVDGGWLFRPYSTEEEDDYLYARFGPRSDPEPFDEEEYWENLMPPEAD